MPQNPTQSRGADDRCIGHGVFGVCCGWVDDGAVQALVVAGDAVSRNHTNHLVIAGIPVTDPDRATMATGYEQGDFDGYAVQATVTDGVITIAPGAGAFDPTLCFIEIGPEGTTITPAVEARLAALVESMTTATYAPQAPSLARRQYVYGAYVDELVSYTVGTTRYYVHANHLYSPSAITNASGVVVERMRYDAYGKQTITTATGTTRNQSAVGFSRGFTGYIIDEETGLYYARARMYSVGLGRFLSRNNYLQDIAPHFTSGIDNDLEVELTTDGYSDPLGVYVDSFSMYEGTFALLQTTDASGQPIPLVVWGALAVGARVAAGVAARRAAAAAAQRAAQQAARRIAECEAAYWAYKNLECSGCKKCTTKEEVLKNIACLTAEIAGRSKYITKRCDYILLGSIAAGSAAKERSHKGELVKKTAALANCFIALDGH